MILFVSPKDIYDIRLRILRANKPIECVMFPQDYEKGSFHLGKNIDDKLVGVLSYSINDFPIQTSNTNCYQLRGMAIEKEYAGKGIGQELCLFSEKILRVLKADFIWCNARTSAIGFYAKQGFSIFSDEFEIEDAGPHIIMGKKITFSSM